MADKKAQNVSGYQMDAAEGFNTVQALEGRTVDALLSTYAARIEGYQVRPSEQAENVTMKISFPTCEKEANASMWAWFIVKAAHPSAVKPSTRTMPMDGGWVVYVSWPIWKNVKYVESKREGFKAF